jgi:CTP synthase (UTP-ammonia lyase)
MDGPLNKESLRIAIIGEFDPASPSHRATNEALGHAAEHLSVAVEYSWLPSTALAENNVADALNRFHGLWTAPGAPFESWKVFSARLVGRASKIGPISPPEAASNILC